MRKIEEVVSKLWSLFDAEWFFPVDLKIELGLSVCQFNMVAINITEDPDFCVKSNINYPGNWDLQGIEVQSHFPHKPSSTQTRLSCRVGELKIILSF